MLQPVSLAEAHMECRYLSESVPVLTDLLAFEKVAEREGEMTLKHPNTEWLLTVHEAGNEAPEKQMHNHYGVRVSTRQEVDAAYEHLSAQKERYGLKQIGKPLYNHGSYSLYFLEPGTNGWEIECYEDLLRKEPGWTRNGGVYAPHWSGPFPAERFPGRGYVPQGFTHGTLAIGNLKASWKFYAEVLGLEVYQANPRVVYIKQRDTKCYVVCALRDQWKSFSPSFRFTLELESKEAVGEAHRWLRESGREIGVAELRDPREEGGSTSFLLKDLDRNWWEIASRN